MREPDASLADRRPADSLSAAGLRVVNGCGRALWHRSAPKDVRRAFAAGDNAGGWTAWQAYLAARNRPVHPEKLLAAADGAISWALPDGMGPRPGPPWLDPAGRLLAEGRGAEAPLETELLGWLGESAGAAADVRYALEAAAAGRAVARLAAVLSPEVWWALLDHLLAAAADAAAVDMQADPLVHQLLCGELPLTLAYLLPEIAPCRDLKSAARRGLSAGLADLLDGEGLPHAGHLGLLRPLLACWTRCRAIGDELKGGCWSRAAGRQYEWVVRQTLRLVRHDGSQVFSRGSAGAWNEELLAAALRLGGNRRDRQIAARVLPLSGRAAKGRPARSALPKPAMHSEWAAVAVMRPRWSRSGERLVILYPGQQFQIELGCGRDLICSGQWGLDIRVDDRPAVPEGDWEQLCWFSDKDVDFLEVQLELGGGLRVQRQVLLAREDRFLLLADVVLGAGSSKLDYRGCLPLCSEVRFEAAGESWEGVLAAGKPRALVLPLALPEWRARGQAGGLTRSSTGLELRQTVHARRLYAPLFFVLDRRRMAQRRTWRQLTVAESLIAQPAEVAVGYRVAVGKAQWLLYRSLGEKANRTLLGHNLSTELLVARFRRSGEVEPLLEIE